MKEIEQRLFEMKEQIETAKIKSAESKGALDNINNRLKTEFKVNNLAEAKELLQDMEKQIEKIRSDLEKTIKKLEDSYDWD